MKTIGFIIGLIGVILLGLALFIKATQINEAEIYLFIQDIKYAISNRIKYFKTKNIELKNGQIWYCMKTYKEYTVHNYHINNKYFYLYSADNPIRLHKDSWKQFKKDRRLYLVGNINDKL